MYKTTLNKQEIKISNELRRKYLENWDPNKIQKGHGYYYIKKKHGGCLICEAHRHCETCPIDSFEYKGYKGCNQFQMFLFPKNDVWTLDYYIKYRGNRATFKRRVNKVRKILLSMEKV